MKKPTATDRMPGPLPEIRANEDGVTFVFRLKPADAGGRQLLLRCDADGSVWLSIASPSMSDQ
jgi:hypothetical protein